MESAKFKCVSYERLNNNNVLDMEKSSLRHLASLQVLDLSWNRIEVLQFSQLAGLANLRIVSIAHNRSALTVILILICPFSPCKKLLQQK